MSKCIKCGRELTFSEIPEFNNGMCDKCYKDYQCEQYPFKRKLYDMQDEIQQLKQQLAEKQNTIVEINNEFVQAAHDWKVLCAEKDKDIEKLKQQLEESFTEEDVEGLIEDREKTIKFLQKELAEKDKEIEECKRNELYEENMKILAVKNQTQLAIQELEKVKDFIKNANGIIGLDWRIDRFKVIDKLDQQIKELKGQHND